MVSQEREALRRVARYIREQAGSSTTNSPAAGMPQARAERGAALADLRSMEVFLGLVREPGWVFKTKAEEDLAEFAGRIGAQVKIVIAALEKYLDQRDLLLHAATCADGNSERTAGGDWEA